LEFEISKILSVYAACLSTIVFVWNVQRAIPRYKVDLIFGVTGEGDDFDHGIFVSVKNPSPHTVHLANIQLLYPLRRESVWRKLAHGFKYRRIPRAVDWCHSALNLYEVEDGCPVALEPGKSHEIFIPHEVLEEVLESASERRIRAVVQDQLWRNKYSKSFDYSVYQDDHEAIT
jgi:hypothetical protein